MSWGKTNGTFEHPEVRMVLVAKEYHARPTRTDASAGTQTLRALRTFISMAASRCRGGILASRRAWRNVCAATAECLVCRLLLETAQEHVLCSTNQSEMGQWQMPMGTADWNIAHAFWCTMDLEFTYLFKETTSTLCVVAVDSSSRRGTLVNRVASNTKLLRVGVRVVSMKRVRQTDAFAWLPVDGNEVAPRHVEVLLCHTETDDANGCTVPGCWSGRHSPISGCTCVPVYLSADKPDIAF